MATDFVRQTQEALWMGEDNAHKNQGQRKRRLERESCINNVKLTLKDHHHLHQQAGIRGEGSRSGTGQRKPIVIDNSTYTRSSRRTREPSEKFKRGSLENVSSNPWGDLHFEQQQSSLRRSRSLAISRQDVFASSADLSPAAGSTATQHAVGQGQGGSNKRRSQLIPRAKLIDRSTLSREQRQILRGSSVENLQQQQQQQHIEPHNHHRAVIKRKSNNSNTPPLDYSPPPPQHHPQQQPYHKPSRSHRPLQHQPYSSLGNLQQYLPKFIIGDVQQHASRNNPVSCDDLPGLSLPNYYPDSKYDSTDNTDNVSLSDSFNFSTKKYSSCDNISTSKWTVTESESISYDENIVLSTNRPLYNSLRENHYAKPRTIRGPTPYNNRERNIYFNKDKRSYSSDSSEEKEIKEDEDKISLDYFETDSNFDEINLNNATKSQVETDELQKDSPVCLEIIEGSESNESLDTVVKEPIKTTIEVEQEQSDEFKTIVTVSGDSDDNSTDKQHSHNYLRDILETQKGSKTPLQNFITKKLSNISRKNSKETNLVENQFHSLPDISISKSLKKCEKIDRKLRKCEKITNLKETSTENRFIVNIGKHFDIAANNVPVDFEVKIAKVKKNRAGSKKKKDNQDLNNNLEVQVTGGGFDKVEVMELPEEYQEKLGAMKNYWGKMTGEAMDEASPKCKIVDVQTKVEDVKKKFEPPDENKEPEKPSKVQMAKQLFEPPAKADKREKTSAFIKESCSYFEQSNQFESLSPSVVEIITKEQAQQQVQSSKSTTTTKVKQSKNGASTKRKEAKSKEHKAITKANSTEPEFDHVRYRVVKSDLFQKKIFANCEKESQFDGLMQYLQDYSFQELLIDNNIVIIEPIRSKIPHEASSIAKNAKNITPMVHRDIKPDDDSSLRRHFFYHPIRVNKEVNDDELPNPDTVKQVRQFFECGLTRRSQSSQEFNGVEKGIMTPQKTDPDKDHCSATDDSNSSHVSDFDSQENLYDTEDYCCEYVSEDILKKIRDCGSTVTYYGGQVVKKQHNQLGLTKVIMEEIADNEKRDCTCEDNNKANYQGVKFKLVKSNSCNSRLQLVGTNNLQEAKQKYNKMRQHQNNLRNVKEEPTSEKNGKHVVNENIKNMQPKPKIIGEERKMTQWGDVNKTKTFNGISYSDKSIKYDFRKIDKKKQAMDEMEFEPYEVAS